MTREYPPEVYGGAGVHVTELVAQLRHLCEVDVHCMGAPRQSAIVAHTDPALKGANAALSTLSADLNMAINQFGRYKEIAPDLFVPNLLLVASDGLLTRVGSITSGRQRFTPWRPESGGEPTLEALTDLHHESSYLRDDQRLGVIQIADHPVGGILEAKKPSGLDVSLDLLLGEGSAGTECPRALQLDGLAGGARPRRGTADAATVVRRGGADRHRAGRSGAAGNARPGRGRNRDFGAGREPGRERRRHRHHRHA